MQSHWAIDGKRLGSFIDGLAVRFLIRIHWE